jgi:hypothetical protein
MRQRINDVSDDGHYKRIAKWFYKEPSSRTISPFSKLRLKDYVANRIREDNIESLQKALRVDPGNPDALAAIASLLQKAPATDTYRRQRAAFYANQVARMSESDSAK